MLAVLGLIPWLLPLNAGQSNPLWGGAGCGRFLLLLPNAEQSDPLCGGAGCGRFLLLLPNAGQSDPLGGGAVCGRFLLPRQELYAYEMLISYLTV
jgi:hypothetical protein